MCKFRLSIQALITVYLCLALVACGGGSSSASTTAVTAYTITTTASTGGSVTPGSTTANSGQTATFTVSAGNGYTVQSVTGCGGTLSGNTYTTGPVTDNCTIHASFMPITYTVTANAGSGGTITPPSTTVSSGQTTTFTVSATSGYKIQSVTGCSGTLAGSTYTTGPIITNCTVNASFTSIAYTVTASAGLGGTITPPSVTVDADQTTSFNVISNTGYATQDVAGCGGALSGNSYTTGKISGNCTITATFAPEWTWEGGSSLANQPAIYGALGVPTTTSTPGARVLSATWTDSNGNLWLFGGEDSSGTSYSDLWMYSPTTSEWTWEGGTDLANQPGNYGTPGVAAPSNIPGARADAVTWTDTNGDFWMFGGSSGAFIDNDLWMYSPTTKEWTWEGGLAPERQPVVYGVQGITAANNRPGGRMGAVSWIDSNGNLWMFGGEGVDSKGTFGSLNYLWMYSPISHEWTWEGGSDVADQPGVYGTRGVAAITNVPGARDGATAWTDASSNFWLFGGEGTDSKGTFGGFNDLWMYSPASHEWTWEGGSDVANQPGVYGTRGVAAATDIPGARYGAAAWTDANGNIWVFGGSNEGSFYNDLWMYSLNTNEWTWETGSTSLTSSQPGVYGTQGVAALTNMPGARLDSAVWLDSSGNLWMFGGSGLDSKSTLGASLDDLWMYPKP